MGPRPGLASAFYYEDFFVEDIAGFADSVADGLNELAWSNPLNATKGIPGTYASVALTTPIGITDGIAAIDATLAAANGSTSPFTLTPTLTPTFADDMCLFSHVAFAGGGGDTITPVGSGWSGIPSGSTKLVSAPISVQATTGTGVGDYSACASLLGLIGNTLPVAVQQKSGTLDPPHTFSFTVPTTPGNTIFFEFSGFATGSPAPQVSVSDDAAGGSNVYTQIGYSHNSAGIDSSVCYQFVCVGAKSCQNVSVAIVSNVNQGPGSMAVTEYPAGSPGQPSVPLSQQLQALNFPFDIPEGVGVIGFQVEVTGKQTSTDPSAVLTLSMLNPSIESPTLKFVLPASEGQVILGQPTSTWGFELTPDFLNNPNFGVQVQAASNVACTFDISGIKIKAFITPNPPPDFNYLKTFAETDGAVLNLALDGNGVLWQEDAIDNPGILNEVVSNILPNSFAQSATQDDREFIAISNLLNGTDLPYTYDGTNFTRCSQVGPGAAPTCTSTSTGSAIESITQNPAVALLTGPHDWLLVSASPADIGQFGTPATPGNVCAFIFRSATTVPSYIVAGTNIFLAGFPDVNGFRLNNDPAGVLAPAYYTVTSVGQAIPGEESYDAIVFTVPFTTFYDQKTTPGCTYQSTLATMTTAVQVPNLEVGNQFSVTGTGGAPPAGYDSSWLVTATPNASQMSITSTELLSNTATYGFVLETGVDPVVGQAVTVTLTLNGNGIFNVTNAIIVAASAGSFSVTINSPNISSAAEDGAAVVLGTIFQFDAFAIVGNKTGGDVVTVGIIGEGIRECCYSFLTEDGYITQPSPTVTFNVTQGAANIAVANLLTGPSNVVGRIVFFTAGNGSNFYYIAVNVPVVNAGVTVNNTATVVNDNVTTNAIFSFSDGVLLGTADTGGSVDVQGNNIFETPELSSCVGFVPYAGRMFVIGEQNKVDNFRNWSFDGGVGVIQSTAGAGGGTGTNQTYPAGWLLDPTNGNGIAMVASPIFGEAVSISNTTGSTQAIYGMLTQDAFQDENLVAIIRPSTTYSVRIAASVPTGLASGGNLVVDLYSPSLARSLGIFSTPLADLGTTISIQTGTMLTTVLAPVPNDLLLRMYATNIPTGVTVLIDRVEPFPTAEPNLSGQLIGSYQLNFEAYDRVTGVIDCNTINQQPVKGAFVLFDTLYIVKSGSILSIQAQAGLEPAQWGTPKTVSASIGTPSIYGVTSGVDEDNQGEEWALIAGRQGLFLFTGGEPVRLSEEIQKLWNTINWAYGYTLWVKNDIINRRILVGVPLKMPVADEFGNLPAWYSPELNLTANPTTPNIVLAMSYKQLTTAGDLAERIEVHASSYTGKLLAIDISRKWSMWTITAPCAAFLERDDNTTPLFFGNSGETGKIYELTEDLLEDDGAEFVQRYATYGFLSTDQEQQLQVGNVRKNFKYMRLVMDGIGTVRFNVYIDKMTGNYSVTLSPDIVFPLTISGDVELPIEQEGDRLFLEFVSIGKGSGYDISKIGMGLKQATFAPTRGRNN